MYHYGYTLENEIFWAGLENGWEKESIGLWKKLCAISTTIVDVGANTGIYALIAKTIRPDARVYAFEPVARVFDKLKKNIELNKLDISAHELALSNTNGTAVIFDLPAEHVYSVTINKNMNPPGTDVIKTNIQTVTLDSFISANRLNKIDLIKIDVETHEPEVLEGFSKHIAEFRPSMLIEVLNDETGERVEKLIGHLGYLYFNIDEKGGVRQVHKIRKSDYFNFLVCSSEVAGKIGLLH